MGKTYSLENAIEARLKARSENKTFVLTNGCFDVLHAGHAFSLNKAAEFGDCLWVAINSDESVHALKGKDRPINCQADRGYLLNSLRAVDGTFFFEKHTLVKEIEVLEPDVYVKSSDYTYETINKEERKALEKVGAKIFFVPMHKELSSSSMIRKIKDSRLI